ncbi:MAG: hypothetical protein K0R29_2378 [Pseudobdellovibrio sp.]|jgi:hypothetical protein|nr:hypothetical protein [Pseudobdellovibrio sp.]
MKMLLIALMMTAGSITFGAECVNEKGEDIYNQPEVFLALIEKADSCYSAQQLASACAYGSSLDVQTAGTAYGVCEAELAKQNPSKKLTALLANMKSLCNKKYEDAQGTMYRSMNSFCHLSAIDWVLGIASPVE